MPSWLKKYDKFTYQDNFPIGHPMKNFQQQHIKELEAQLAEKKIKAFKRYIEIAERKLKIEI
jgi:transposase